LRKARVEAVAPDQGARAVVGIDAPDITLGDLRARIDVDHVVGSTQRIAGLAEHLALTDGGRAGARIEVGAADDAPLLRGEIEAEHEAGRLGVAGHGGDQLAALAALGPEVAIADLDRRALVGEHGARAEAPAPAGD